MTWSSCGKIDNWLITRQKRRQLFTSFVTQLLSSSTPFLVYFLMAISVSIARALSSLDPVDDLDFSLFQSHEDILYDALGDLSFEDDDIHSDRL